MLRGNFKQYVLLFLLIVYANTDYVLAQYDVSLNHHSKTFRDTLNICRHRSRSPRGIAFDSIVHLNSLKGLSMRKVKKIFGKPFDVREPNEPNLCKAKEDVVWRYPISCGCFEDNRISYQTCDFALFYFYKRRLVCIDGWDIYTFKVFH